MIRRQHRQPRSCDLLNLVDGADSMYLVWMVDDSDTVIVRGARDLDAAAETARAYGADWGAKVRYIEAPDGSTVDPHLWAELLPTPQPYVYTVEMRSSPSAPGLEMISALWSTPDLDEARRWRDLLPESVRRRTLIVSSAPEVP